MKNLMKCAAILAATLLAFGFASCKTNSDDDSGTVSVTSIELNKTSTSIGVGETETLTATVKPDNATDKSVTWTSSKAEVATVDKGVVTAVAKGTATITAKAGDKTATCTVTVADVIDLSEITEDTTIADGTIVTGTLGESYKISIAEGATVLLKDVTIKSLSEGAAFAGINCAGDATLVIEGTNTVESGNKNINDYPAILITEGKNLTIQGTGSLTATGYGYGAGIGGGNTVNGGNIIINSGTIVAECKNNGAGIGAGGAACGDITLNGGTITAIGGNSRGAGIGGGGYMDSNCGNIEIKDGTVTATGGGDSAGIGTGCYNNAGGNITISGGTVVAIGGTNAAGIGTGWAAKCGTITITEGVDVVTATKGEGSPCSIGKGKDGNTDPAVCGKITIGGDEYPDGISQSPFTYDPDLPTYTVTVTSGTATPSKAVPGRIVTINASTPAEGKAFDKWTTTTTGVSFADETALETTFEMPASNVAVTATYKDAPWDGDLSKLTAKSTEAFATATDGMTITGTLAVNVKVSIADGAKVTLNNASINADESFSGTNAGLTCVGDAEITLTGSNNVKSNNEAYAGIYFPEGKTLTIKGDGALIVAAKTANTGGAAGIGANLGASAGNIVIQGGTITATGSGTGIGVSGIITSGAGIGSSGLKNCGNIIITGGTVTATGVYNAAAIGSGGASATFHPTCGTITIADTVTKVTATKGSNATKSIGEGYGASCGTVTIGGTEYPEGITKSPFVYRPNLKPMEQATADDIGKVIGADGYIYDNKAAAEAEGTTASAMIAYVGSATEPTSSDINASMEGHAHGLAIALSSAGSWQASWSAAKTSAASYAAARPARASTWRLPSAYQWMWMLKGCGSSITPTTNIGNALEFQNGNISDMSQACGGGSIYNKYWTSTEKDGSNAYECRCDNQHKFQSASKSQDEFASIWAIAIFAF